MRRVLLVGEQNPYGPDQRYALFPEPPNCAGWRLCHKVLGIPRRIYMSHYDRVNLCNGPWRVRDARQAAAAILDKPEWRVLVLLGAKVTAAFGRDFRPFTSLWVQEDYGSDQRKMVILPHPSGRNLIWNDPSSYVRAREILAHAGALP